MRTNANVLVSRGLAANNDGRHAWQMLTTLLPHKLHCFNRMRRDDSFSTVDLNTTNNSSNISVTTVARAQRTVVKMHSQ
jgi:hypothetical protein